MSDNKLLLEIEKAESEKGDEKILTLGGNYVISFKHLTESKKPISIKAPFKTKDSEYIVEMEYGKDKLVKVTMTAFDQEIRIKSLMLTSKVAATYNRGFATSEKI